MVTSSILSEACLSNERSSFGDNGWGERCSSAFTESEGFPDSPRTTDNIRNTAEDNEGFDSSCCDAMLSERLSEEPIRRGVGSKLASTKLRRTGEDPSAAQEQPRRRVSAGDYATCPAAPAQAVAGSSRTRPTWGRRGSAGAVLQNLSSKAEGEANAANQDKTQKRRGSFTNAASGLHPVSENQAEDFRNHSSPLPADSELKQKLGFEWMARLQGSDDNKQRSKDACRQILWHVEDAGLHMTKLESHEKITLNNKVLHELDGLLSHHLRQAFDVVSADAEELASLRKTMCETEERISNMNRTYLKEISTHRNKFRTSMCQTVAEAIEQVEENNVEFYEPLQYLSTDTRSTVLAILDEKIKAIFAIDESFKQRTNAVELAKFEDAVRTDRLRSFEKMNSVLRNENRDFRQKLQKTQGNLEKHEWELHEMKKKNAELEAALAEATFKPETNDIEVQCEPAVEERVSSPRQRHLILSPSSEPLPTPPTTPRLCITKETGAVSSGTPKSLPKSCDVGVQADVEARRPSLLKRKSSFEMLIKNDDPDLTIDVSPPSSRTSTFSGDLGAQLTQARRQVETSKKSLHQRDAKVQRLETDLKTAQKKIEELETELQTIQDLQALQEVSLAPMGRQTSGGDPMKRQTSGEPMWRQTSGEAVRIQDAAAEIRRLQEELETAQNETQVARHQARILRSDLEAVRKENSEGEKRRLEILKGNVSEEINQELEEAVQSKNALFEELEQTKAAFSMVLSRNASLEMAVAALSSEGQDKPPQDPKPRPPPSGPSRQSAALESDHISSLVSQRAQLREKNNVQKAQLQAIMQENTALHLALQEMQNEIQNLTKQLRNAMPDIEVMSADLEVVLGRMDKVVRDGGGAYMRLHKDARLREIALETKNARCREEATAEAEVEAAKRAEEAMPPICPSQGRCASPRSGDMGHGKRSFGGGLSMRSSKVEPLAPVGPPPDKQGPRRATATKTWAAQTKDVHSGQKHFQRAASTNVAGTMEMCGSVAVGSKGGMAILGRR